MEYCLVTSLYQTFSMFGDQIQLKQRINSNQFVDWTESNFEYVRYNPRKDINRWGLSLTSLHGGLDGIPDLDSLREYNKENNTGIRESDFSVQTPVMEHPGIKEMVAPWENDIFRSHVLKLGPGGFFPPHRDIYQQYPESFRLIAPLKNTSQGSYFILDEKILHWDVGSLYYINTAKSHTLFNATMRPSYWLVLNVGLNPKSVDNVLKNFAQI